MAVLIRISWVLLWIVVTCGVTSAQTLYKCKGEDGAVTYSDRGCPAEAVELESSESKVLDKDRSTRAQVQTMENIKALERERCGQGNTRSCRIVECLQLQENAPDSKVRSCRALSDEVRNERNLAAAKKSATGESYSDPYLEAMYAAGRKTSQDDCSRGDESACRFLKGIPNTLSEAHRQTEKKRQELEAGCRAGNAKAADCEWLFCTGGMTPECLPIMKKAGRNTGTNWYESERRWVRADVALIEIQCTVGGAKSLRCQGSGMTLKCERNLLTPGQPAGAGPKQSLSEAAGAICR
jgi:hypothetical protein